MVSLFILDLGHFFFSEFKSNFFSVGLLNYMLLLLSLWISFLIIIGRKTIFKYDFYSSKFIFLVLVLLFFLILSFSVERIIMFYIFFESRLIPTFMLILGWGYQRERIQAGLYILFYTLVASLPLLLMIYIYYYTAFSFSFDHLINFSYSINFYFYFLFTFAFLVKLPIFLVHLWLPKAHVEAPVSGSMILAGVLLKLGGYGLMQFIKIVWKYTLFVNFYYIGLRLVGGFLIRLVCLRQSDLKILVAYSSVSHMGIILAGFITLRIWGVLGAFTIILAHGLCSSGLFYLCNLVYERSGSRRLLINKGILRLLPKVSLWWFLFCITNMAAPPSINLLREIFLINSLISWRVIRIFCLIFICFFVACYCLYIFRYSQHGKFNLSLISFSDSEVIEYLVLFLHLFPIYLFILNSDLVLSWICLSSLIKI